jgi:hypothetical protein
LLANTLLSAPARAEEPAFSDRLFYGSSGGELPDAKLALVGGLYASAIASSAVGVVLLFSAANEAERAERFKRSQERGFCNELTSDACSQYRARLDSESEQRQNGLFLLGVGGLLGLSGALTAELWKNDAAPQVSVGANADGASVSVTTSF